MKKLLLQKHRINFASPYQIIEKWLEMESLALVEKEMEFGTTHDKDDFREREEEFLEKVNEVKVEQDKQKKLVNDKLSEA